MAEVGLRLFYFWIKHFFNEASFITSRLWSLLKSPQTISELNLQQGTITMAIHRKVPLRSFQRMDTGVGESDMSGRCAAGRERTR